MDKIDNIKDLYSQIEKKTKFLQMVADDFGIKGSSVRSNWFGSFWDIPEKKQDRVIELLQNTIANQNKVTLENKVSA